MIKEKLNKLLKDDGNSKKKIENLVFFLIILVITIVAINTIWKEDKNEKNNSNDNYKKLASEEVVNEEESLETKLENILSNINGVGNVKVLLTYNETEELVPVYNETDKKSTTNETDSGGGTRTIEELDNSKEVIYQNNEVVIQKKVSPKIEGAIITAKGANNATVKTNIIQAVEAATRTSNS